MKVNDRADRISARRTGRIPVLRLRQTLCEANSGTDPRFHGFAYGGAASPKTTALKSCALWLFPSGE
jgi:hypothetical protein